MVEKWRRVLVFVWLILCILEWKPSCINAATNPNDTSALKTMYSSLNSPGQLSQWAGDDPCGQSWKGVTCSGQRVTEIKISDLGLTGQWGWQLSSLTSVTNL
ncbi:protein STRUBBELIG-RECEPTOR FAMILY 7-like [Pistacia vera]|uniref:protein STRUBBELIG-RECEPTOR FAMILY 7-like n=1 Tax=Pistacia vera TaxID=55513 RepID=UPI00126310BF|nr:protein STRUBBELIG-RECEPTOR FAMILY 7-like [Pistacia vera]